MVTTLALTEHNRRTQKIKEVITNIKRGLITSMIPREALRNDMEKVAVSLSGKQQLPMDSRDEDAIHIFRYSTIKAALNEYMLLIEIEIPIALRETFFLYKAMPIPILVGDQLVIAKTKTEFFLLNTDRNKYIELSEKEVENGVTMANGEIIYAPTTPTFKSVYDMCMGNMLIQPTTDAFLKNCEVGQLPNANYVLAINKNDLYYAYIVKPMKVWEQCEDLHHNEHVINTSGTIQLSKGCVVHTDKFSLHPHDIFTINSSQIRTPKTTNFELDLEKIANATKMRYEIKLNITEGPILINEIRELSELSEKTKELVKHANFEVKWKNISASDQEILRRSIGTNASISAGMSMSTTLIFAVAAFAIYRWHKKRKTGGDADNHPQGQLQINNVTPPAIPERRPIADASMVIDAPPIPRRISQQEEEQA